MRRTRNLTLLILAALVASPGWAGDSAKKKCNADVDLCIRGMAEKLSKKGWIGIEWNDKAEIPVLTQVIPGSPAEAAGLSRGDKVLAFNGVSTSEGEEAVWAETKKSMVPGKTITITIERAGVKKDVDVLLVALPRHVMAQWIGNHVLEHHLAENDEETGKAESPRP